MGTRGWMRAAAGGAAVLLVWLVVALLGLAFVTRAEAAQAWRLERVVVVMRHGIRPPTRAVPVPVEVASQPWPQWDVGWGELTHHGEQAIARLAELDARSYAAFAGCDARVVADIDQRTLKTAEAWARTALPDCRLTVEHGPLDQDDPRFSPFESGAQADGDTMLKAAQAALPAGGLPAVDAAQRARLRMLARITGCDGQPACDLSQQPTQFAVGKGRVKITGGIDTGSTLAQALLLEYADGKPLDQVGWGHADGAAIADLAALHAAEFALVARPKAIADFGARPLLAEVERGLFATDTRRLTVLVGHDSNLAYLGGALGVHWRAGDLAQDDPAPGGALIFEKWRDGAGQEVVIVRYRAQSLEEMRNLTPLTEAASTALAVPFCHDRTACTAARFHAELHAIAGP